MEIIFEGAGIMFDQQGLSKYELLQSADQETTEQYKIFLEPVHGALFYNADNDAATKFRIANTIFQLTDLQRSTLQLFGNEIVNTEKSIDPPRLRFEIGMTSDNEIYISRTSSYGVNNILIYEDGTMAHSFIGYKESEKQNFLDFLEPVESIDYESLLFKFFSFR
jgi:hypothetical protein